MCPICWISGFIAALLGGSMLAVVNHPISWIISLVLILYAGYKFYESKKRGLKMNDETKARNRKTIFRFIQGVVLGSFVTAAVFYSLTYKEHERMHDLLEKHGIEKHEHLDIIRPGINKHIAGKAIIRASLIISVSKNGSVPNHIV